MPKSSSPKFKLPPNARAASSAARRSSLPAPSTHWPALSVFFKCENFQRGGAFKIRGASNFILSIPDGELAARRRHVFVRQSWTGRRHCGRRIARYCGHYRDAGRRACVKARGYRVPTALESSLMIAPLKIVKPSRSGSRRKPAPPLFLPTIIPGPSRAKAPPHSNCWTKFPISTRSWCRSAAAA